MWQKHRVLFYLSKEECDKKLKQNSDESANENLSLFQMHSDEMKDFFYLTILGNLIFR